MLEYVISISHLILTTAIATYYNLQKDKNSRGKTVTEFKEVLEQVLQCDDMEEVKITI